MTTAELNETDVASGVSQDAELETTYTKLEQRHYEEIRAKAVQVGSLESEMEIEKSNYTIAKKRFEAGQGELRAMIQRGPSPQLELPFPAEAWREADFTDLGITGKLAELLTDADLDTLGKIADFTKDYELTNIAGVGPAKAEELQSLLDKYWVDHPEHCRAEDSGDGELANEIKEELAHVME